MKKQDGETSRNRRNFLKTASGAAVAFAAVKDTFAQNAGSKSAAQKDHGRTAPADRGIWITWYDLPTEGRDAYFSWLHGTYLPDLLKRPGYLWAAHYASQDLEGGAENATRYKHVDDPRVGKGYHYMLLIAAADANVFGDPVPSLINAALPEQGKKMLAMRTGAPCVQIGSFDCALEFEEEMHAGYVLERLPKMCATPSCVRTRKLNSVAGWAKHGIIYEFASKEGFDRDYAPAVANSPLGLNGRSVVPNLVHAPNGPNSALRIWPPVPKA
jgi:hypothetical protein